MDSGDKTTEVDHCTASFGAGPQDLPWYNEGITAINGENEISPLYMFAFGSII